MSRIVTKIYKYDSSKNDYKGEDFSKYVMQGDESIDNLDDTLDTYEITLSGLPFRKEFAPSTKFIIEKWGERINNEGKTELYLNETFDLVVSSDSVDQPIMSDDNYFNHHLSLIEPSVEAQGRLVDNIAVTYRLKDITLESKATYDTDAVANLGINSISQKYQGVHWGSKKGFIWEDIIIGHNFEWIMPNWYTVNIDGKEVTPSWSYWNNFKKYQEIQTGELTKTIELPMPMLKCSCATAPNQPFRKNGYCSYDAKLYRQKISGGIAELVKTYRVNPSSKYKEEKWERDAFLPSQIDANTIDKYFNKFGVILSKTEVDKSLDLYSYPSKVAEQVDYPSNRVVRFDVEIGYKYSMVISLATFTDFNRYTYPFYYSFSNYVSRVVWNEVKNTAYPTNIGNPSVDFSFFTVLKGETNNLYMRNAPIENAYNLFNKAQLCTQNVLKQDNIPVNETESTFYLGEDDKQELKNTEIVENFYNQKNLWELFMDIGKYIHARPKIKFGENNKYLVTWKKYGLTKQYENNAFPISVYNSRFIEEYVSACSSYVTNMVQLGGTITEYVAPKSSSENYLVYNDNAEIITEKNIIELVDMEVIDTRSGESRNLTGNGTNGESKNGYVFEENIYNLLSINKNTNINKGLAIYYKLGTNKIVGLNYRLPTINTGSGANDYAIKRIIGTVFGIASGYWQDVKINNYIFKIVYRTKDTLRSNQTRPDLRKYLLSSKFDKIPQHNQFNNQQDLVVDSNKFGNNIYGKLIRTGNTVYSCVEWVSNLSTLKHSGELYEIYGERYYVSKVKNTYYSNYIISEVEYSKDFNRLSQIIGIPSEPRFYEISEQSLIRREIALDDYIVLGTNKAVVDNPDSFIKGNGWAYIDSLLFKNEKEFPKYAVTCFKNDINRPTAAGNETFKTETCHPACSYSIQNTLTVEWDMKDNFSAGDMVEPTNASIDNNKPIDTAYNTLIPFRYADVYGRCDMIDFAIIKDYKFKDGEVRKLPQNPIVPKDNLNNILFENGSVNDFGSHTKGIITLKDNREALNFNYNLQMLTDSDRFVLSAYLWQPSKGNVKIALLNDEVNKISNETIPDNAIAIDNIDFTTSVNTQNNNISININEALTSYAKTNKITLEDLMEGKNAIVLYSSNKVNDEFNTGAKYFVMARNIGGLDLNGKTQDWVISNFDKNMFTRQ